jgi:hypothetical protein
MSYHTSNVIGIEVLKALNIPTDSVARFRIEFEANELPRVVVEHIPHTEEVRAAVEIIRLNITQPTDMDDLK